MNLLRANLNYEEFLSKIEMTKINKSDIFKIAGCGLLGFGLIYVGKIWYSYSFFKKRGIPTPEYEFFFGNFRQLRKELNYSSLLKNWGDGLGKTYGYYEGHLPIIVTRDLDLIQEVFIKQYNNFAARKKNPLARGDNEKKGINLFLATNLKWKRMRNIMNPTFSSSKMRDLIPLISTCADRLVNVVEKELDQDILIFEHFKRFTMDTIWNCAFGVDIDLQNNHENEYYQRCEHVMKLTTDFNIFMHLGVYLHEFKYTILKIVLSLNSFLYNFGGKKYVTPFYWLLNQVVAIVDKRRNENIYRKDYLQLLLDAETHDVTKIIQNDKVDFKDKYIDKKMQKDEIVANTILFMLAGYETTSNALNYSSYVLATHPEEQQKLIDEIDSNFNPHSDAEPDSDNINKLEYLDMFIKEVLRLYPIGNSVVTRRCTNPTTIKGIKFETDMVVAVDVLSVHLDPELWGPVDPNEFYPLRFSPEIKRNPLAFMSFGLGPRNCIGMKFALIELKMALVKLLMNFEVHQTEKTPIKLDFIEALIRYPKQPIIVSFKKRKIEN